MTRRPVPRLECLEPRDAPATLVSGTTLTYRDADGDRVTVTFSRPVLTAGNVNTVFTCDIGSVDGTSDSRQQLRVIDLTGLGAAAAGAGVTTVAVRDPITGGDGFAALGHVKADGLDLGTVAIDGDLGLVACGDADPTTAGLAGLAARSMGRYGTVTGAMHLSSRVEGRLGFVKLKSDLSTASIDVQGGPDGDIGPVTIGGALLGSAAPDSGLLNASGDIGPVTIRGDVVGGGGAGSGSLRAGGRLAGVTIGGALRGGAGAESGQILARGAVGAVKIAGDVAGGDGGGSGSILGGDKLAGVTIGGSLLGGSGDASGRMLTSDVPGPVRIAGNLTGGPGEYSGSIETFARLNGLTVGGSLLGGGGRNSGSVFSHGPIGVVRITGHLIGGGGDRAGSILGNAALAGVVIGGSLVGDTGSDSGSIYSQGLGPVRIAGDVIGGSGGHSGTIESNSAAAGVTVGGSLKGGAGNDSGHIESARSTGMVKITGDVVGGSGNSSGEIDIGDNLEGLTIGGSLRGGAGSYSGRVWAVNVGSLTIAGDLVGGSAGGVASLTGSGYVECYRIARLTLGGSLIAGTDDTTGTFENNGAIRVHHDLGAVVIKGSVLGNGNHPAIISARGSATPTAASDLAIQTLRVLGRVEFAQILAGVDVSGTAVNADAQIGAVTVGGDWVASSLAAGAVPGNGYFGDADDARLSGAGVKDEAGLSSRIASVAIGGQALGTLGAGDHFGIVAEEVAVVTVGMSLALGPGSGNDTVPVGITGDFRVNEV